MCACVLSCLVFPSRYPFLWGNVRAEGKSSVAKRSPSNSWKFAIHDNLASDLRKGYRKDQMKFTKRFLFFVMIQWNVRDTGPIFLKIGTRILLWKSKGILSPDQVLQELSCHLSSDLFNVGMILCYVVINGFLESIWSVLIKYCTLYGMLRIKVPILKLLLVVYQCGHLS